MEEMGLFSTILPHFLILLSVSASIIVKIFHQYNKDTHGLLYGDGIFGS
jgi:hypothetical protein